MLESRMWAEDPVSSACSVVELPEVLRMEAKSDEAIANAARPSSPPIDLPTAILGIPFSPVTLDQTIQRIEAMVASRVAHYIVTANVDFVVQARSDVELHRILVTADMVLCDGQPLVWASRWLGHALPERVAGSDLVPDLITLAADRGYRIFFLGGSPDVATQAVSNMQALHSNLNICGFYSPPFNALIEMDHDEIAARIRSAKPDLLFVSLGCPKAEKWMFMHYRSLGVPVSIGVGGTIDFLAGRLKRAPLWMRGTGIEWVFRLIQEPRRLYSRYARDVREFGCAIVEQLWRLQWRRPRHLDCPPAIIDVPDPTWRRVRPPEALAQPFITRDKAIWSRALKNHCLVELSRVRFVDSAGIGLLIELQRQLAKNDLCLVLIDPSSVVRKAIRVLHLDHWFLIARDTMEARDVIRAQVQQRREITALSAHATRPLIWQGEITAANAEQMLTVAQTQIDSFTDYSEPITIDLSAVTFIDSTGVGLLLRAQKHAAGRGAQLQFLNPQAAILNVLRMSRLESVLLGVPPSSKPKRVQDARRAWTNSVRVFPC